MVYDVENAQEKRRKVKETRKHSAEHPAPENPAPKNQADLLTGEDGEFEFVVLFYTPKRGNFERRIKLPVNDPEIAKKIAIEKEQVKGYHQAQAHLLSPKSPQNH